MTSMIKKRPVHLEPTVEYYGGSGNNTMIYGGTSVTVWAAGGDDFISDNLSDAYNSRDFFFGQDGADTLVSYHGGDYLDGGAGWDEFRIWDPGRNTQVVGGDGVDKLTIWFETDEFEIKATGVDAFLVMLDNGKTIEVTEVEKLKVKIDPNVDNEVGWF